MLHRTTEISAIAAERRSLNARRIAAALCVLTTMAVPITFWLGSSPAVMGVVGLAALGQGLAYWLVRSGRSLTGLLLSVVCLLWEHVGVVAVVGDLGPIPYLSPIVVLLVAATASSRWLWVALGLTVAALAAEAMLSPWHLQDQIAIVTAGLFVAVVFVVSMLHVGSTERAFAIAEQRDSARALAASQAQRSERLYRLIADNTDDLISLVSADGKALYLSPSHEKLLGVSTSEMLGHSPRGFLGFENLESAEEAFRKTLTDGEAYVELSVTSEGAKPRLLETRMSRVEAEEGVMVAMISRDVTTKRVLEQRLIAAERLEALGRLAGSIAHDFNNLLTVIGGAAELARGRLPPGHKADRELEAVLGATATATRLTKQLLTFSRRQLTVSVELDLVTALEEQRELLERMVGKAIELRYEFAPNLPRVRMPASHLEQLAMNLVVNGRDAMPEGGCLTLKLERCSLDASSAKDLKPGEYVEFSVHDEGTGIPADVLPHLFDPFFTTKGEAGTGLGLATCHSVAHQLGGRIEVDTAPVGTTFRVLMPATTTSAQQEHALGVRPSVHRVLVVDDERAVRETTGRMLEASGYQVWTASTVLDARQILEDPGIDLDAVVTDVVLSGALGTDLLKHCREHRPTAHLVVMSGYAPDPSASALLAAYSAEFLPKPFAREQLLRALHHADFSS